MSYQGYSIGSGSGLSNCYQGPLVYPEPYYPIKIRIIENGLIVLVNNKEHCFKCPEDMADFIESYISNGKVK